MDNKFAFVVSNGPKVPKDPALRTLIRKQAMRDVAIERRKRSKPSKGRVGSESATSVAESSEESSSSSTSTTPGTDTSPTTELVQWSAGSSPDFYADWLWNDMQASCFTTTMPIPNPLSAYDALCAKYNLNLEQMSGLTCFGVSTPIVEQLGDINKLKTLLGHSQDTYLRYVPSRYGKVKVITAVVDCVMAKLSSRLKQHDAEGEAKALRLYAIALQEVQSCVADPAKAKEADTICAIMLLCLYELLDPTKGMAFQQHVFGIAHLARHRKASSFQSDYEKMLLYGSLGSTVIESIMKWDHCYLEAPEWHEAYMGFTEETTWLTYRSPLTVRIHLAETHLAGLIGDTNIAMRNRTVFEPAITDPLRKRLADQHQELLECMAMYNAHLMQVSLLQPPQIELDLRRELMGSVVEHLLVIKRMMGALTDKDRIRLETETYAISLLLQNIHDQPGPRHAWLFDNHELNVLHCIRSTSKMWEENLSAQSEESQKEAQIHRWEAFILVLTAMAHPRPPKVAVLNPTSADWSLDMA